MKRAIIISLSILFSSCLNAQRPEIFGNIGVADRDMTYYDKAPDAHAVVLHERGDNYFVQRKKGSGAGIYLVQQYYNKIKIFKKDAFHLASITIPIFGSEKLENLKAVTHNKTEKYEVLPSDIYINKVNEFKSEHVFTFSNVVEGSIIEYQYDKVTPYYGKLKGWSFQSTIPKMYSEFNARIPGHLRYNRVFFGDSKLDVNSSEIEKYCFKTSFMTTDCERIKYVMKDVPAFIEEPEFMLSRYNYVSRLEFELAEVDYKNYGKIDISTTWKELDEDFMKTEGIGGQLVKNGFFQRKVPEGLLAGGDKLSRAKKIFEYVKNYYTWDESFGSYRFNDVREAFKKKKGSVAEINMTLINLLNEAGIRTTLMLCSTRQNGLPKKSHPSVSDFNYFLARVVMNGKTYLLDASDKKMPFGMVPFRALNLYGRVMDFERKSYWSEIKPKLNNLEQIRSQIILDPEKEVLTGILNVSHFGYPAIDLSRELDVVDLDEYSSSMEGKLHHNATLLSYKLDKEKSKNTKIFQRFDLKIPLSQQDGKFFFNPFLIHLFENNPFRLESRKYPIDFGYPRMYKYSVNMTIPKGYVVQELPKPQSVLLGDKMVDFKFYFKEEANQIAFTFNLSLNNTHFKAEDYQKLKAVFKHVMDVQNNSLVVLKKL